MYKSFTFFKNIIASLKEKKRKELTNCWTIKTPVKHVSIEGHFNWQDNQHWPKKITKKCFKKWRFNKNYY